MRILILTPTALPSITGNAITAERWRQSLTALGHEVRVAAVEGLPAKVLAREIGSYAPDVIHAHHAYRAGSLLLDPALEAAWEDRALVVSPAGTDIYLDTADERRAGLVRAVFGRATGVVTQGAETARQVLRLFPGLADRLSTVPKAFAWLGDAPFDLRGAAGAGPGDVLFFQPAGIRPVKGNLEFLLGVERAHGKRPAIRSVCAGPILDAKYGERFERELRRLRHCAAWLPSIPPRAMRAAFGGADVVVNASAAEGLSNALLEAAAAGKPVLASDVPGNRDVVLAKGPEPAAGLLFDREDPLGFAGLAVQLADDGPLRRRLGEEAHRRASRWPSPAEEAGALIAAYEQAADSAGQRPRREERIWREQQKEAE